MKRLFLTLFLIAIIFQLLVAKIFASYPQNTITVLPQINQIDLAHDEPQTQVFYTNNSSTPVELILSVQDVRELEDRNPVGILDPKEASNYKYSLSSWVYLDKQTLILNPGETKSITVTIVKDKLSPGGHYGSVLAEIKSNDSAKKTVKIKGILASLLFVRAATGSEIEEAKIAFFGPFEQGLIFPSSFFFRFQNTGNVDLTPYGLLEIKDEKGRLVAKGVVNEDSLITLPEAIRKYEIRVKPLRTTIFPGKYTAILSLHFGKGNKTLKSTYSFVTLGNTKVVQWGAIVLIFLILIPIGKYLLGKRIKKSANP